MEKYLLQEKVGEGLLGEVFKAVHYDTKQICAIKIIHLDQPPEDPEDVQKELNFLKNCDSQHIIKYYETILKDDTLYLVMEYVTPGSLKDYLMKVGPVTENYISMILREMLMGLEYLQIERRCHRNLKASNVLLSEKGEVKLCDLVVGGSLGDATRLESVARAPYWIAPEVMSGNPKVGKLDKQDIWSIGITAYEIATGMPPYHDQEPMKMNLLLARGDPPRLEGDFSRSFKDFVNLCLSKEVKKRPSIKELLTHPFIRKSKKIYNLLDMVGKLSRQQHRISQRNLQLDPALSSVVAAHNQSSEPLSAAALTVSTRSPKRTRAFSTNAITGRLRSDTSSDDSGNELSGTLSFSGPPPGGFDISHSPSLDSAISSAGGTKIGMTISRLRTNGTSTPPPISTSTSSSTTTTSTTLSTSVLGSTSTTAISPRGSSAFTSTSTSAFTPTSNPLPSTTTTTTSDTNKSDEKTTKVSFTEAPTTKPALSSSATTPSVTVTTASPLITSPSTPSLSTVTSPSEPPAAITTSTSTSTTSLIPNPSPGGLSPHPHPHPTVILPSSNSNENINESDFQSFVTPLSPPVTPKLKPPLLTMPPTSSFLDSVILPVLAKKSRAQTEEMQGVMQELKDAFKKLETIQSGASQQLVNDWVEAVLWENYSQQEKGSPMANYLLLRWKNGTPL